MTRRTRAAIHGLVFFLVLPIACQHLVYRHMNDPERDGWQQPKAVIRALRIEPGAHVADLGAGGGYFTFFLAEAVGPQRKVYAVDTDEGSLRFIEEAARRRGGM